MAKDIWQTTHLRSQFQKYYAIWREDTMFLSDPIAMSVHPSMAAIASLGEDVVPLVLEELEKEPSHIFMVLPAITGENVYIPEEDYGKMDRIVGAWLRWGKERKR